MFQHLGPSWGSYGPTKKDTHNQAPSPINFIAPKLASGRGALSGSRMLRGSSKSAWELSQGLHLTGGRRLFPLPCLRPCKVLGWAMVCSLSLASGSARFLEAKVSRSKTSYTLERKTRYLPMAAPAFGVTAVGWSEEWLKLLATSTACAGLSRNVEECPGAHRNQPRLATAHALACQA